MGQFVEMAGFWGRDSTQVKHAIKQFAGQQNGLFREIIGPPYEPEHSFMVTERGNTTVLFGKDVGNPFEIPQTLAGLLDCWGIHFEIHDGDLWHYRLFENGDEVEAYSVLPDYWGDTGGGDTGGGDAEFKRTTEPTRIYEAVPKILASEIQEYFRVWTEDLVGKKAYERDIAEYHNPWQVLDCMEALGLRYPIGEDDGDVLEGGFELIDGDFYRSSVTRLVELDAPQCVIDHEKSILDRIESS